MGQRLGQTMATVSFICVLMQFTHTMPLTTQQQKNAKGKRGDMEVYKKAFASLVMVHKNA